MKIKITEEQLQSIVANEQRNHVSARTKVRKSENEKEYQTASKVVREQKYKQDAPTSPVRKVCPCPEELMQQYGTHHKACCNRGNPNKYKTHGDAVPDPGLPRISRFNEENLDEWIKKPKDLVRKTKMIFPGLKKPKDRENIIAYLKANSN